MLRICAHWCALLPIASIIAVCLYPGLCTLCVSLHASTARMARFAPRAWAGGPARLNGADGTFRAQCLKRSGGTFRALRVGRRAGPGPAGPHASTARMARFAPNASNAQAARFAPFASAGGPGLGRRARTPQRRGWHVRRPMLKRYDRDQGPTSTSCFASGAGRWKMLGRRGDPAILSDRSRGRRHGQEGVRPE